MFAFYFADWFWPYYAILPPCLFSTVALVLQRLYSDTKATSPLLDLSLGYLRICSRSLLQLYSPPDYINFHQYISKFSHIYETEPLKIYVLFGLLPEFLFFFEASTLKIISNSNSPRLLKSIATRFPNFTLVSLMVNSHLA